MTPQRAKELLPIITAYAEGKTIQGKYNDHPDNWDDLSPNFDIDRTDMDFRIKPEPGTRPWSKPEDVPVECWVTVEGWADGTAYRVVSVGTRGIGIVWRDQNFYSWERIEKLGMKWSADLKQWFPCTVTEEA